MKFYLRGNILNYPNFDDNTFGITSEIAGGRIVNGEVIIETQHSKYILGTVDPDYEKVYPNAFDVLMKRIDELNKGK